MHESAQGVVSGGHREAVGPTCEVAGSAHRRNKVVTRAWTREGGVRSVDSATVSPARAPPPDPPGSPGTLEVRTQPRLLQ